MSPNGRRAWRKWAARRRRLFRRLCRDLRSGAHTKVTPTPYDAPIKRRVRKSSEGRGLRGPRATPSRPFTPRSLVGMTMGARKRLREAIFCGAKLPGFALGADSVTSALHIGERLRPCPGCPECGADSMLILRALSRRMNLRLEIRRCNSSITPSKFDYLAMLHRPGPAWNPVCGFGQMRIDAVRALCDVILKEGTEEFPIVSCDGSGVLPARRSK